jgi:hypothetical protein
MPKLFTKILNFSKTSCLIVFLFLVFTNNSFAQLPDATDLKAKKFGLVTVADKIGIDVSKTTSVAEIAGNIIGVALSLLGVIFMILIVYGGYMWMMARGNESESDKAKEVLVSATIGITIVFSAYVFTNYILTSLSQNIVSS